MAVCTNALCQGPEQCTQTVQYRSESINYDLGHLDKTIIEILSTHRHTDPQTHRPIHKPGYRVAS